MKYFKLFFTGVVAVYNYTMYRKYEEKTDDRFFDPDTKSKVRTRMFELKRKYRHEYVKSKAKIAGILDEKRES